jgi:6-phosphogluconolactonase (cycloisomerase 2 family)
MGNLKAPIAALASVCLLLAGCETQSIPNWPQPAFSSIAIAAATTTIDAGSTLQLTATGTASGGTTQNITTTSAWSSSNPTVLTVSASGLVTAVAAGTASVGVLNGSTNQTLSITVVALQSIAVTGPTATIFAGRTVQLTATGTYTNNSTGPVTATATWNSLSPGVATVSGGLVTGVSAGTAKITASSGGVSGFFTVTVYAAGSIMVTPTQAQVQLGSTVQLTAQLITGNITSTAAWTTSDPITLTVVSGGPLGGLVTARKFGSATITATMGANQTSVTVTVTAAPTVRLAITANPADSTLSVDTVNDTTGTLTPYTYTALPSALVSPVNVLVDPTGQFAYVAVNGGVGVLKITSASGTSTPLGTLTPLAGGFYATANLPTGMALDPTGAHLYVADGSKIFAFAASSGVLTAVTGSPFTNVGASNFVGVDPLGRYLYSSITGSNKIAAYAINSNGSLTALTQPTFNSGQAPEGMAFDASGLYLYVANSGDGSIGSYTITPGAGTLTLVNAPTVGTQPVALASTPAGLVYFLDASANVVGSASVNLATGALTDNATTQPTAASGTGIVFNPAFNFLYAVEPAATSEAETYSLDPSGNPVWASAIATRGKGAAIAFVPGVQTVYGPSYLYSLVSSQGNVEYDIDTSNGTLSNQTNVDGGR